MGIYEKLNDIMKESYPEIYKKIISNDYIYGIVFTDEYKFIQHVINYFSNISQMKNYGVFELEKIIVDDGRCRVLVIIDNWNKDEFVLEQEKCFKFALQEYLKVYG